MKKTLIALSIAALLLVTLSQAAAQCPKGQMPGCIKNLSLTPDQKDKFDSLRKEFLKETLPIRSESGKKVLEFRILLAQPSVDVAKAKAKQQEIFALKKDLQEKSLAYYLKGREILTPQQISMLPPGCCLGFKGGFNCFKSNACGSSYGTGKGKGMKSCPFGGR